MVGILQQKCWCLSNMMSHHVSNIECQSQLDNDVSGCSQVSVLSAKSWLPLFLKGCPSVNECLSYDLSSFWRFSMGVRSGENVRVTSSDVPWPPGAVLLSSCDWCSETQTCLFFVIFCCGIPSTAFPSVNTWIWRNYPNACFNLNDIQFQFP